MSLKTPIRALSSVSNSFRSIASSSRVSAAPTTPGPVPEETSEPSFAGLLGALKSGSSTTESSSSSLAASSTSPYGTPSLHTPERANAIRGYTPESLPPQIDPLLDLFTNMLMKHGRKAEAQSHVSDIMSMLQKAANQSPQPLLSRAISLASPAVRLNSTRKRAKIVQTPKALDERQRTRQGIVWLLKASERGRKAGLPRDQRIAREVLAVLEGNSEVYKWVEERHRLATANRSNLNSR